MTRKTSFPPEALALVVAPMVDASDFPFRLMCIKGGATMTYTQMYLPGKVKQDEEYRTRALRDLDYERSLPDELRRPVVVQLGGRNIDEMVEAAQMFTPHCDGIDINCGCPQEPAMVAGYGSALLARKNWDHLEEMVKSIINSVDVPVSVKIRLCTPVEDTLELAKNLEALGVSHISLHARFPSAKKRRHGAAKLEHVKELVDALIVPVLSNGNVRSFQDLSTNLEYTGASGLMVGEELMRNPYLFQNRMSNPFDLTNEYLETCSKYPDSTTIKAAKRHIKYFFEQAHIPKAWSHVVKKSLNNCEELENMKIIIAELEPVLKTIVDC